MNSESTAIAAFLDLAVREQMLTRAAADDLAKNTVASELTIGQFCVEAGRLSSIQSQAIEGVLNPHSIAHGYEVVGLLGYGGIGIVYRARQPSLDRMVALKTISTVLLSANGEGGGSNAAARFRQEAVAIARLQHPNIVTAYDCGTMANRVYLAMELVDGIDLESHITQTGCLDEFTAWRLAMQVAAALAHALESGIVHRDIKPGNLLVTDPQAGYPLPVTTPMLKVTDFGLAQLSTGTMSNEETRLTIAESIMGTPYYMAPEQIEDPNVGFEADIYALGATVYHMLAGAPPFAGMPMMKVLSRKLSGKSMSLENLPENLNQSSIELLSVMMEHDPSQRPQSYDELIEWITQILKEETSVTLAPAAKSPLGTAKSVHHLETLDVQSAPRPSIHKKLWIVAALAMTLVGTTAFLWTLHQEIGSPPTRHYVESASLTAVRPLYRGRSISGWHGVARAPDDSDYAGMLRVLGNARKSIEEERQTLPLPDHFGIAMRVGVDEHNALEVWFETGDDGKVSALRIENNAITLGHYDDDESGEFVADSNPVALVRRSIAPDPLLRIDRDENYWLIGQSVPGEPPPPRVLARTPIASDPPTEIRFKADGDAVYLGEIELVALERNGEPKESP